MAPGRHPESVGVNLNDIKVRIFESYLWHECVQESLKHGVRTQENVRDSPVPENEKHGNLISPGPAETQLKFEQ